MISMQFHHIGLACRDLERERDTHRLLGFRDEGPDFADPLQQVRGCFMVHGGLRVELLEPTMASSPVQPFLNRHIKMYHQAFVAVSIRDAGDRLVRAGARLCGAPKPAIAFDGREVVFVLLPTGMLVELIAQAPDTCAPEIVGGPTAPGA